MNIVVLTTLYPNNIQHRHGVFIENRVRELVKRYPDAQVKVIAPVPYFPSWLPAAEYKKYSQVVTQEKRSGIDVFHPKYLVIPKVGMNITPYFLYRSCLKALKSLTLSGYQVDMIDSHYFYPDGVVAAWLGKKLNIPVMVTARGSDINVIPDNVIAGKRIKQALMTVNASAAVSQALANEMVKLAPQAKQPIVLRNGVDLDFFTPDATHPTLPFSFEKDEKLILSVGNLIELKGHHLIIEALTQLPKVKLIVIGEGQMRAELTQLVTALGLQDRVFFTGNIQQAELPGYYASADLLVLASSREGMPNVLLEALASGTPVVATNVGGSAEIITHPNAGELIMQRDSGAIAASIHSVLAKNISSAKVREQAEHFGWQQVSEKQYLLLKQVIKTHQEDISRHG
ncbi:glycosyltransferase family 4 protein [Colwellia sp. D2M02]|uniref:glycosyltransferase family 4 protein n=1 Tax=Colwellia sp. D2M02 TaxID=2841562 RepID=UPI001C0A2070|nr:glycosyltransferase family 4 protein [Colwellia sp. D2M02]MBU2894685.1 glycosyltransferase family 4 protein [Colwellia sp. D2M02]